MACCSRRDRHRSNGLKRPCRWLRSSRASRGSRPGRSSTRRWPRWPLRSRARCRCSSREARRSPPEVRQILGDQMARLASLDALGRAARRQFTVELVGEADADGAAESNLPLSQRRAERVLGLLAPPRLEHVTLTASGIGSRSAADSWRRRNQQAAQPPRLVPRESRRRSTIIGADASEEDLHARGLRGRQDEPGLALRDQHLLRHLPHDHRREDRQEDDRRRCRTR